MSLKLGAYTACLHDRPLAEALNVLKSNGLTSVEVNTGASSPLRTATSTRCCPRSRPAAATWTEFSSRGMELTGLNCNGNPLNPLPGVGPKHADDLRRTIELAGLLGVRNVVTMSGTPGSDPDARYPSWVVNPWDGVYMDVLDYQWGVAAGFWSGIDALAQASGVRVAIEMHPHNLVFSPVTLKEAGGPDRRDARRRRDGPLAPDVAGHGHRRVYPVAGPPGVPRRRQGRHDHARCGHPGRPGHLIRAGARRRPRKVPTGYGYWCNAWPESPPGGSSQSASGTTSRTGRSSSGLSPRSTPAWRSTSSTRTPLLPSRRPRPRRREPPRRRREDVEHQHAETARTQQHRPTRSVASETRTPW